MNIGGTLVTKLLNKGAKLLAVAKVVSPELCLVGSIVTGVACVVTACMSTVKSEPVVEEVKKQVEEIKHEGGDENSALMTIDQEKQIKKAYVQAGLKLAKNYALPAALGALSIALNIGGNRLLRKNLAAVTAAYAALYESYQEYRRRVIADSGIEKDQEYMHGVSTKAIEMVDENGTLVAKDVNEIGVNGNKGISRYARWFDCGVWDEKNAKWKWRNEYWKDDPFINWKTIKEAEIQANIDLQRHGYLFLNDVYKMLGLAPSLEGQIVGWTQDGGDGVVSFGVFDVDDRQLPVNRAFINRQTPNALLDFNVDGPIINKLTRTFGDEYTVKLLAERS